MLRGLSIDHFGMLEDFHLGLTATGLLACTTPAEREALPRLERLSALIGRNSSGKTTVLNALAFVSAVLLMGLPEASKAMHRAGFSALRQREHDEPIRFDFVFDLAGKRSAFLHYELAFDSDSEQRPFIVEERLERLEQEDGRWQQTALLTVENGSGELYSDVDGLQQVRLVDRKQTCLALYGRMLTYPDLCRLYQEISRWYVCRMPSDLRELEESSESGGHKHLNERCDNVKNVLYYMKRRRPEEYRQMLRKIQAAMPKAKRIDDAVLDRELSSGHLKLFIYLLLLHDPRPLICLDSPEDGLYHDMVEALMRELRRYLLDHKETQVFLTTHNSVLLDCLRPDEVFILNEDRAGHIGSRSAAADPLVQNFYDEGLSMGTLWYGGHLGVD